MAIPFSTSSYRGQVPPDYEEALEHLNDLTELLGEEAVPGDVLPAVKILGADTTSFSDAGAQKFITEHLIPAAVAQAAPEQPLLQLLASQSALTAHTPAPLPPGVEDKNITANYLFSLNPLNQVRTDMQKPEARRSPNKQSSEHSELLKFIRENQRDSKNDAGDPEPELGPMLEAMTNEMPQVTMELPGGVGLRFAVGRDGKISVMYETADGQLRTLPKGKTLRLERWVNGVTLRNDGSIALTP